jgi:DNA transformation protein
MAVQAQYLAYVLEQLAGLGQLSMRRMFGAVGLYSGERFFAVIDDDTLFFKTNESNYADYEARRMPRFMPTAKRPVGPMGYHQVPADVIEDGEMLVEWARKAVAVARPAKKGPARKKAAGKKGSSNRRPARSPAPRRKR